MIICSMRTYLNVLTQLWNRDTLLNANYFIMDNPTKAKKEKRRWTYDENNNPVEETVTMNYSDMPNISGVTRYNINYVAHTDLDPTVYRTTFLSQADHNMSDEQSVYMAVIDQLNKEQTKVNVLFDLFAKKLEGNEIQILIYYDESILVDFGNLICQYLSQNFGCDIIFLDAICRPHVMKGQPFYKGNKEFAEKYINYLRDYKLYIDFQKQMTLSNAANVSNLTTFLRKIQWDELLKLYNILFPNEPLAPGNYTEAQLRDIIIGKTTEGNPDALYAGSETSRLIYSTQDIFEDQINDYDTGECEDWFSEEDYRNLFSFE